MRRLHGLLALVLLLGVAGAQEPADLILHNASVWTVDADRPEAQAIAVRGSRIIAIGSNDDTLALKGDATRTIDCKGRLVLPGFCDNHVHFQSAARFHEFNIMSTSTQAEFIARLTAAVEGLAKGQWIRGGYWGAYDQWAEGSSGDTKREPFAPVMSQVEALTADHPVFIQKFDGSKYAANRAAMKAMRIDPDAPEARGVTFHKGSDGKWNGLLSGGGIRRLQISRIPRDTSRERRLRQTRHALKLVREAGVTTVSDMSDDVQLDLYRELRRNGELTLRIDFRFPMDRWKELASRGIRIGGGDEWISLGGLKSHIDGIMGTSSARFFEPYTHEPTKRGRWRRLMYDDEGQVAPKQFLQYMLDADKAGLQLTIHAIGDEANHLLLEFLEELNRQNGQKDRRFRIVHAQVIHPDDFKRLGPLGVVAEVQPFHLSDDMRWMEERIGTKRCEGAYAFKRIRDAGAVLSFGTDWPGTSAAEYPINPMLGLYAAVTRKTVTGQPKGGWFPKERIAIEEAIEAYTKGTAYALFQEKNRGTLTVGKLADIVVLSKNILEAKPEELLTTKVDLTVIGGKVVFER